MKFSGIVIVLDSFFYVENFKKIFTTKNKGCDDLIYFQYLKMAEF